MIFFDLLFEVYQRLPTFPGCDTPPVFGSCRAAGVVGGERRVPADLGRGMPGALGTGGGGRRPVHGLPDSLRWQRLASAGGRAGGPAGGGIRRLPGNKGNFCTRRSRGGRCIFLLDTTFRLAEQPVGTTGRFWRPGVERQCGWERFGSTVARPAPSGWWTVTSSTLARRPSTSG